MLQVTPTPPPVCSFLCILPSCSLESAPTRICPLLSERSCEEENIRWVTLHSEELKKTKQNKNSKDFVWRSGCMLRSRTRLEWEHAQKKFLARRIFQVKLSIRFTFYTRPILETTGQWNWISFSPNEDVFSFRMRWSLFPNFGLLVSTLCYLRFHSCIRFYYLLTGQSLMDLYKTQFFPIVCLKWSLLKPIKRKMQWRTVVIDIP